MTGCETKKTKAYIKIVVILVMVLLSVIMNNGRQVYAESKIPAVSIYLKNSNVDKNMKEAVYGIKNRTEKTIKVRKVIVEKYTDGQWTELERKDGALVKRNIKIQAGKKEYDSILLNDVYSISQDGLEYGKYRICISYRLGGKSYEQHRKFMIEEWKDTIDDATVANKDAHCYVTTDNVTVKTSETLEILLNSDFNIDSKGNVSAVVFSENHYKTAKKTKVRISIQKKKNGKWVKYKKYQVTKKSNIAYANKKFKVKRSGTYRMKVDIIVYKKNKKYVKKTYRSLEQTYRKE
jgi:hypothetical protein